jgi:hypothetical protein
MLMLVSIGIGQSRMTPAQRKAQNEKAKWVEVATDAETGKPYHVDARTISVDRKTGMVAFELRTPKNLAGYNYATIIGSCVNARYTFTNIFTELGNVMIREEGIAPVAVAEEDSIMWAALAYACRNFSNPNLGVDNDG